MHRSRCTPSLLGAWTATVAAAACSNTLLASQPPAPPAPSVTPAPPAPSVTSAPQDTVSFQPAPSSDAWRVDVNLQAWLLGVTGDVGARGATTNVDASFGDILEASDSILAFSGRVEVRKNDWGVYLDGLYANIGADDQSGPLGQANVDVTTELALLDFGAMYRLTDWTATGNAAANRHQGEFGLYAGGRYTSVDLTISPAMVAEESRSESWVDPTIGAMLTVPLSEGWHLKTNGDIGGFGVASQFAWSVTAVFGYDFSMFDMPSTFYAGYRGIGQDYSEGSGSEEFTWDVVLHGPIIGLNISF
jgi:hypothetical protein